MQRHCRAMKRGGVSEQLIEIDDGSDSGVALVSLGVIESLAGVVCSAT